MEGALALSVNRAAAEVVVRQNENSHLKRPLNRDRAEVLRYRAELGYMAIVIRGEEREVPIQ
jgi:hypothetical protein